MRDLLDRLDGWRDEQIEFLARLVNHDSGTDDPIDSNRVGAILAERLDLLGFTTRRIPQERFGDHRGAAPTAPRSSSRWPPCWSGRR